MRLEFPTRPARDADYNENLVGELDDLGAVPKRYRLILFDRRWIYVWETSSMTNGLKLCDVLTHSPFRRASVFMHELKPRLRLV